MMTTDRRRRSALPICTRESRAAARIADGDDAVCRAGWREASRTNWRRPSPAASATRPEGLGMTAGAQVGASCGDRSGAGRGAAFGGLPSTYSKFTNMYQGGRWGRRGGPARPAGSLLDRECERGGHRLLGFMRTTP